MKDTFEGGFKSGELHILMKTNKKGLHFGFVKYPKREFQYVYIIIGVIGNYMLT